MGDISAEPSMEDILSSIKRIIAEEGDAAASTRPARKSARTTPRADTDRPGDEEILELSDPVATDEAAAEPLDGVGEVPPASEPVRAEPILSPRTAEASRGALDALSRLVVKPEVAGSDTLEGLVREMIRPMLREWLDAKLPAMVETMVAREIERITRQGS